MRLPNWFKITWWILLLGMITYFIIRRYDSILKGSATSTDIFIFLIWISLLLFPLFQEISFFGMKLKKEIDSLKSDVKEQMVNLRSEVQNSVAVQTQFRQQIIQYPSISDSGLPGMGERYGKILEKTLISQGIQSPVTASEGFEIPDNTLFLFSVRYEIERELRRIWKQYFEEEEGKPALSVFQIVRTLSEFEIINPKLTDVIREVYKVCTPAIHGALVSENQANFVRNVAPKLIASLKVIQ